MSKKILVIDDAKDIADTFKKQLDLAGYEADVAYGGKQAVEMLSSTTYDLALLDLVMPDMDGVEVLTALKNDPGKYGAVPVIALTNITAEDYRKEVEDLGVAGFFVKTDVDVETVVHDFFHKS